MARSASRTFPRTLAGSAATCYFVFGAAVARAGMPAPLPNDYEAVSRLTDSAHARVQAISFFAVGLLVSVLLVQLLWNGIRRDFPRLPRLRFPTALAVVVLWGLMFVVVLTMISGARELMTPGAWEKQGFTYKLAGSAKQPAAEAGGTDPRVVRLRSLGTEFLRFAAKNDGRFPETIEAIAEGSRTVPGFPGLTYLYMPGLTVDDSGKVLLYEPEVDHDRRLALFTDGEVRAMTTAKLRREVEGEVAP